MNNLDMKTKLITEENIEKIGKIFPNVIVEAEHGIAIDFDLLKQELSDVLVEGNKERYQLTWPGKKEAILLANKSTTNTLRPCIEESVDFENTQNLYIEGDNLEVLKILQESYLNKIKCIYIDPPYNTGNDFIYKDDFKQDKDEYLKETGQVDEEGNRLVTNSQSNGRYHSDWLSMMYPRLKLARNLLSDDGAIFISIDENEVHNLRKICDEIFGENNFVCEFVWQKNFAPKNDNKYISISTESILCYTKNKENFERGLLPREEKYNKGYSNPDNDHRGPWTSGSMLATTFSQRGVYEIIADNGTVHLPPKGRCWRFSKETVEKLIADNKIWFGKDGNGVPRIKRFLSEMPEGIVPQNLLKHEEVGSNQEGNKDFRDLFNIQIFDFPKPINLIIRLLIIGNTKNSIILDFFSGSSTTAHAVMQLNAEDGGNRKYIMVQLPEETDENSESYKAGYENICEIGKERIRRAAKKIKEETNADIDYGFRVYKLDSSNMKDVYYNPKDLKQEQLIELETNIKEDRTSHDLLTQVILDLGLELSLKIEMRKIKDNNVYFVEDNSLVACFDDELNIDIIDEICEIKPLKIVFRDSSFKNDKDRINVFERIKRLSLDCEMKVI